jgi:hypothetical protein
VVFQLFQDLDTFNIEDYRKFDDGGAGMNRLLAFVRDSAQALGAETRQAEDGIHKVTLPNGESHLFTTNRNTAKDNDDLGLLGLEHPLIRQMLDASRSLLPRERAIMCRSERFASKPSVLSVWRVEIHGPSGYFRQSIIPLAVDAEGHRLPMGDAMLAGLREVQPALDAVLDRPMRDELVGSTLPEMLRREVEHRGLLREDCSLEMHLIGWAELC